MSNIFRYNFQQERSVITTMEDVAFTSTLLNDSKAVGTNFQYNSPVETRETIFNVNHDHNPNENFINQKTTQKNINYYTRPNRRFTELVERNSPISAGAAAYIERTFNLDIENLNNENPNKSHNSNNNPNLLTNSSTNSQSNYTADSGDLIPNRVYLSNSHNNFFYSSNKHTSSNNNSTAKAGDNYQINSTSLTRAGRTPIRKSESFNASHSNSRITNSTLARMSQKNQQINTARVSQAAKRPDDLATNSNVNRMQNINMINVADSQQQQQRNKQQQQQQQQNSPFVQSNLMTHSTNNLTSINNSNAANNSNTNQGNQKTPYPILQPYQQAQQMQQQQQPPQQHSASSTNKEESNNEANSKESKDKKPINKPVEITSRIVFLKVGQIDTRNERYDAEAYIECSWEDDQIFKVLADPNLAKNVNNSNAIESILKQTANQPVSSNNLLNLKNIINNINALEYDPNIFWSPQLYIENAIGDLKEEIRYKLEIVEKASELNKETTSKNIANCSLTVRVCEMRKLRGVFYERLELYDFPMDIQELSITLTSKRSENDVHILENKKDMCSINTEDFLDQQEWDLFGHVKTSEKTTYDPWRKYERSCFSVTCFIARKPGYYLYNAYMLIFLITILGFVPFAFAPDSPQFRCQVTGLLLLTSVNFRWIVTQRLPSVPYLTSLDKYAIGSLLYLVLFCVWHSMIGSSVITTDGTQRRTIDGYVLYGSAGFYLLYNLFYILWFMKMFRSINKFHAESRREKQKADLVRANNLNEKREKQAPKPQKADMNSQQQLIQQNEKNSSNSMQRAENIRMSNKNNYPNQQQQQYYQKQREALGGNVSGGSNSNNPTNLLMTSA